MTAPINYSRRPAKHIQRRMVVDVLPRLRAFDDVSSYSYVGFGGMEFVDFELIHRELGINRMTSIELNGQAADRYRFNRPFASVDIRFGRASDVLPSLLDPSELRIVWLDYECGLNSEVLQDVGTCIRKLLAGSVLIVSVNAQGPTRAADRLATFVSAVGEDRVPAQTSDTTLAKWGWANAVYQVLSTECEAEMTRRADGACFQQLFHFRYADGAKMLTWGGLVVGPGNKSALSDADFASLPQVRGGAEPYEIAPPILTMREALHLNAQLPAETGKLACPGIQPQAIAQYADLYRWYPAVPTPM